MNTDCLLKIHGIDGESTQDGHAKWIELISWKWGETNAGSSAVGAGAGSGKVAMKDFVFTVNYGTSSPKLLLACATGQHIPSATLHLRKAGGSQQTYMEWRFTGVMISTYKATMGDLTLVDAQTSFGADTIQFRDGDAVMPVETISFNFTKIEMEYRSQGSDGKMNAALKAGIDVKQGCSV